MPFQGGPSDLVLKKRAVFHPPKYRGDPEGQDKVVWQVEDLSENPVASDFKVKQDSTSLDLPDTDFYSTIPGIYQFDLEAEVDGVLVKKQPQQVRIVDDFRRYLVPHTHCVVDVNKPVRNNEIHVVVGERIEFLILHPLLASEASNVGININVLAPSSRYQSIIHISSDPSNGIYKTELVFHEADLSGYDVDFVFEPFDTGYLPLSLLAPSFKIIVHSEPTFDTTTPAVLDDGTLRRLYESKVFDVGFKATVRTVGNVGSVVGDVVDGDVLDYATVQDVINLNLVLKDDAPDVRPVAIDPTTTPVVERITASIRITEELINDNSTYHFKSFKLDGAGRYIFHSLPLPIDPSDLPVSAGYDSVIPYWFYIEDTQSSAKDPVPIDIDLLWEKGFEVFNFALQTGEFGSYELHKQYKLVAGTITANEVHRINIQFSGTGYSSDTFYVNGHKIATFYTSPFSIDGATFEEVRRWIALGNFIPQLYSPYHSSGPHERAAAMAGVLNEVYLVTAVDGDIREFWRTGIGACGTVAQAMLYFLGAANYNGSVYGIDDIMTAFDPSHLSSSSFPANINNGLSYGLPFGQETLWNTVSEPMFIAYPDKLCYAVISSISGQAPHAVGLVQHEMGMYSVLDSAGGALAGTKEDALLASRVVQQYDLPDVEIMAVGLGINRKQKFIGAGTSPIFAYPSGDLPSTAVFPSYDPDTGEFVLRDINFTIVDSVDPGDLLQDDATVFQDGFIAFYGGYQDFMGQAEFEAFGEILYRGENVTEIVEGIWNGVIAGGIHGNVSGWNRFFSAILY